jgi:hypothetical protein
MCVSKACTARTTKGYPSLEQAFRQSNFLRNTQHNKPVQNMTRVQPEVVATPIIVSTGSFE